MRAKELPFIGATQKDAKHLIVEALSEEWPLSIKQIRSKISTANKAITYQGVHKAVLQLLTEGVLSKHAGRYSLSSLWLQHVNEWSKNARQKQFKDKQKPFGEELNVSRHLKIYFNRTKNVYALAEMINRTKSGDTIVGQSKSGFDYPMEFYEAISRALERGVKINFIIPESKDSSEFYKFLKSLKSRNLTVKTSTEEYIRMFGIKGREVMIARAFHDSYLALHFSDEMLADYLLKDFEQQWKDSTHHRVSKTTRN